MNTYHQSPSRRILASSAAALLALCVLSPSSRAGNTWDGGGLDAFWSTNNNWNLNTAPNYASEITFTGAVGTSNLNDDTLTTAGIAFDAGASAFTLSGIPVTGTGGITNLSASTQTISFGYTLGESQSFLVFSNTLTLTGGIVKNGVTLTLEGAAGTVNVNTIGISGAGANSDLIVDSVTANLNVANTYNGPTLIRSAGVINANALDALPTLLGRTALTMDDSGTGSSVLNLNSGISQEVASLTGAVSSIVNLGTSILTIGTVAGATNFSGQINGSFGVGSVSIVKDGLSTQTFSGANTYLGLTNVNAGTLRLGNALALGSAGLGTNVASGATLDLNGQGIGAEEIGIAGIGTAASIGALNNSSVSTATLAGILTLAGDASVGGSGNISLDGKVTGAFQLTKVGAGTVFLTSNANDHGQTTVSAGILEVQADNALGTVAAGTTVASGATLRLITGINLGTEALTLNGDGTGVANALGALTIASGGTVTLGGPITVASNATIHANGGTIHIDGTIDKTSVNLTLAGGGTINVNGAIILSGAPAGFNDDLIINGTTANLNNANTYLGTTFVRSVVAGDGQVNANVLNALPTINGRSAVVMDDAGAGSSVLNLSGSTGFPLGANQSVASLAGAASSGITLGANTLTIGFGTGPDTNGTAAAAFLGVISGTGGVIKDQSSVAIFSGLNTYTGTTNIDGGILVINGSVRSSVVSINPNGTLMGTGTAFGNVTNAGNFSPGNSPGKFTIGGNYTQTTGGTLNIEIAGAAASQHDLVTVGKVASLAGNLKLIRLNQFRPVLGDRITFLTAANGVTGRFSNVLNPFIAGTILEATVVYTATTVSLEMEQGSFGAYSVAQGMTPNQQSVAFALDKIAFDTNQSKLIGYLNSQLLGNLAADFDLIAPEELQSIFTIGISQANIQTANLTRRMDDLHAGVANFSSAGLSATGLMQGASTNYLRPHSGANGPSGKISKEVHPVEAGPFGLFVTGSGEWAHVGSTDNASGYDLATGGFTIGLDYKVNSKFVIGINTGYARTSADLTANGNITVDGAKLGLYGTYFDEGFYLNGSAQGGYNSYDTKRGALQGTARGSTHGGEFNALIATGYDWKQSALTIGPIASVQYSNIGFKNFEESGSLAPLDFDSQSGVSLRTALGMRASYDCRVGGVVIRPEVRAAWQHEFGDTAYDISSSFSHGGANFTVQGAKIGRESVLVGAGVAVLWNERTSTYVYYDGELGRTNYQSNNVSAGVRWEF